MNILCVTVWCLCYLKIQRGLWEKPVLETHAQPIRKTTNENENDATTLLSGVFTSEHGASDTKFDVFSREHF